VPNGERGKVGKTPTSLFWGVIVGQIKLFQGNLIQNSQLYKKLNSFLQVGIMVIPFFVGLLNSEHKYAEDHCRIGVDPPVPYE
jgi:hypothetical protein